MVMDYVRGFYGPAALQGRALSADGGAPAAELATWKQRVTGQWGGVSIHRVDQAALTMMTGERLPVAVAVDLNDLVPQDVVVECLIGRQGEQESFEVRLTQRMQADGDAGNGEQRFSLELETPLAGLQYYKIRVYPFHHNLSHRFEMGCMLWL